MLMLMMVSGKIGRCCAWRVYQVVTVYCQQQFSLPRLQLYIGGLIWLPFFSPLELAIVVFGALVLTKATLMIKTLHHLH